MRTAEKTGFLVGGGTLSKHGEEKKSCKIRLILDKIFKFVIIVNGNRYHKIRSKICREKEIKGPSGGMGDSGDAGTG
jgi:hypothetical protein